MDFLTRNVKRFALEGLGWLLVVGGIAGLILPGPGLLAIFAGMALLATQYDWAERRVDPIRQAAFGAAEESVKSWPRIITTTLVTLALGGIGVLWGIHPAAPQWWPLDDKWWLVGGLATGAVMIASSIFALSMLFVSYRKFHKPKA